MWGQITLSLHLTTRLLDLLKKPRLRSTEGTVIIAAECSLSSESEGWLARTWAAVLMRARMQEFEGPRQWSWTGGASARVAE